jgi:FMN phosphatase YigB (HAD superfamily)
MRAVLFDLDGTLLDIQLGEFIGRYFSALASSASDRYGELDLVAAVRASTEAMMAVHAGITNRDAFYADFLDRTAIDLGRDWPFFEAFYRDVFPSLREGARPSKGARRSLETARELDLRTAVATNPIFPRLAVHHRLGWAGIDPAEVDIITTYEEMHACKPHASYFRETAAMLGVNPSECLMVGDDRYLDLAASDVGMRTFYVGSEADARADFRGDLDDLADLLRRLTAAPD